MKNQLSHPCLLLVYLVFQSGLGAQPNNPSNTQQKNGYDYYYHGLDLMQKERFADAIAQFNQAENEGLDLPDLYNNRGICYYNSGKYLLAIENYNHIIDRTTEYKSAYINIANAYYKLMDYKKAEKAAKGLLKQKNFEQYAYNTLGNISYDANRFGEAISYYKLAIQYDGKLTSSLYNLGNAYFQLNYYDTAIYYFQKARAVNPTDIDNLSALAQALSNEKRIRESIAVCREILVLDPDNFRAYAEMGYALMKNPNYNPDEVLPHLQKAIEMAPEKTWYAKNNMGTVYLRKGMLREAFAAFDASISDHPNAMAFAGRANIYRDSAYYKEAIRDYLLAIYYDTLFDYPNLALGGIMVRLKKEEEATAYYNRYLELSANKDEAERNIFDSRAYGYLLNGNYALTIYTASEALQIDPEYAYALSNLGMAYAKSGNLDSAIYCLNRSAMLDPYNSYAFHNRAFAFKLSGKDEQACRDLGHAFRLHFPIAIDPVLVELNQNSCRNQFSSKMDLATVSLDSVLNEVKQEQQLLEQARKVIPVDYSNKNIAGVTNASNDDIEIIQQVFPNPAVEEFTLQLKGKFNKPITLQIIGINGQQVRQINFSDLQKTSFQISCHEWAAGTYSLLLVADNQEIGRGKIVVSK